jgi:hypothetical protein
VQRTPRRKEKEGEGEGEETLASCTVMGRSTCRHGAIRIRDRKKGFRVQSARFRGWGHKELGISRIGDMTDWGYRAGSRSGSQGYRFIIKGSERVPGLFEK